MTNIKIAATKVSPEVILDAGNNIFSIKGRSIVAEVDSFYAPIVDWVDKHGNQLEKRVDFIFDLEFFNIFSSKRILFLLYRLSDLRKSGVDLNIIWYFSFEDDDMKEVGEDFACMVNLPFEFISKAVNSQLI